MVPTHVTSIEATGLFPFLDGFGVYAGTCQRNNPANWQSDYFQVSGKGFVVHGDGETDKSVLVQMGRLNVNVKNSASTPVNMSGALVTVRQGDTGTGCNTDLLMASGTTNASGNVSFVAPVRDLPPLHERPAHDHLGQPLPPDDHEQHAHAPALRPPSNLTVQSNLNIPHSGTGTSGTCSTAADL